MDTATTPTPDPSPTNLEPATNPTPLSEKRLLANRLNALRSTGPRTPAGKARAAQNALTHGLRRSPLDPANLVPATERDDFARLLEDLRQHLDPRSSLEDLLVERIALLAWKLRRHAQAEARLFDAPHDEALAKHQQQLEHARRYRTRDEPPPAPTPAAGDLLAQFARTAATNGVDPIAALQRYETATRRAFTEALQQYRLLHAASTAATDADDPAAVTAPPSDLHHHFHYHHHAASPTPPSSECARFPNEPTDPVTLPPPTALPQLT